MRNLMSFGKRVHPRNQDVECFRCLNKSPGSPLPVSLSLQRQPLLGAVATGESGSL